MRKQQGLSLIELLIAITLGLVLIAGVIQMFLSSRVVFSTQQAVSRVQEGGRLAVEFMSRDIRMAGYMGCADRETEFANDLPDAFWTHFTKTASIPAPVFSIQGLTSADSLADLALTPAPVAGSDILVVRYAAGSPHVLAEAATKNTIKVRAPGVTQAAGCINGLCKDDLVVVSNCVGGHIFAIDGLSWAADVTTITHSGGWPITGGPVEIVSLTDAMNEGSELLPVVTVVYYVGLNPAGRPSLYRRETGAQAVELIEGVENASFRYRTPADDYQPALAIGSFERWAEVDSVSIELLLQGNEDNVLEAAQSYTFGGEEVAGPADRRVRQVFNTTVTIRSRVVDLAGAGSSGAADDVAED